MNFSTVHVINLREEPQKWDATRENFLQHGVNPHRFIGVNGPKWGLETRHTYDINNPGTGERIDSKHVGMCLSHYWLWRLLDYRTWSCSSTGERHLICEDDCRFTSSWRETIDTIEKHLPSDWDILFPGSCCTQDKNPVHISGPIWKVRPFCTHCYIVRRRVLPIMIETQEKAWAKIDVALYFNTYPFLNTYAILPAIAFQEGTPLHP